MSLPRGKMNEALRKAVKQHSMKERRKATALLGRSRSHGPLIGCCVLAPDQRSAPSSAGVVLSIAPALRRTDCFENVPRPQNNGANGCGTSRVLRSSSHDSAFSKAVSLPTVASFQTRTHLYLCLL